MTPPRTIADRYELGGRLGRGGMAEVYAARDRVLDREVAVKVLSERFSDDERFVTRFRREAQSAARLNHRNIVSVYDTGAANGTPYIVMEKVDGPTLADVLRAEGALPPERAAEISGVVAEALEAAHREELVHRDVKPGNIMLTRTGEVKVLDFGIARAAADDTLTQTGTVLGTASYLSPEQASGGRVDARSDVYSLGCVLYEMLTGRPPFTADSAVQVAYQQVHQTPSPPSQIGASVPPALEAVVMRALDKDPGARYASGGEMRDAIAAAVSGSEAPTQPVAAPAAGGDTAVLPPTAAAPPAPPGEGRPRWLVPVLVLVLLGLLAAGAYALLSGDDRRPRRERPRAQETGTPVGAVDAAFAALQTTVTEGVTAGEISEEAGGKIVGKAGEGVAAFVQGDVEGALKKIEDAQGELEKAADEGEITSEERAGAIQAALLALGDAIEAEAPDIEISPTPSPTETSEEDEEGEEGNGNPGNSGKGKSKGKGKGKGND